MARRCRHRANNEYGRPVPAPRLWRRQPREGHQQRDITISEIRVEFDGFCNVEVPANKLWGVLEHDLMLKKVAPELGFVDERTFDRVVDPAKMVQPYVAETPS